MLRSYDFLKDEGYVTKPVKEVKKKWFIVDATGCCLGRFASIIASILRGKNKPFFTPFMDCGDNVVIINASKIVLKGNKMSEKSYLRHTGYPGGQRFEYSKTLLEENPVKMLVLAIKGMLPKNRLGRKVLKNVRIFKDCEHNMQAVKPEVFKVNC